MKPIVILYNYQTLLAGLVAFAGAAFTVRAIKKQISQAEEQERERRRRRNLAARSFMPVALSAIGTYSQNCYRILHPILPQLPDQRVTSVLHNIPDFPGEALSNLRDSIEFADDPVAEKIADLLRKIQIQHSRLSSTEARLAAGELVLSTNILDYMIDALEVNARASKLLPYARRETDDVTEEINENDLIKAARLCGVWDENEYGIYARIRARFGPTSAAREEEPIP